MCTSTTRSVAKCCYETAPWQASGPLPSPDFTLPTIQAQQLAVLRAHEQTAYSERRMKIEDCGASANVGGKPQAHLGARARSFRDARYGTSEPECRSSRPSR